MVKAVLAIVIAVCGCNTYKNSLKYIENVPEYRTFWSLCWNEDGTMNLPSDEPPHTPPCDRPEVIYWPDKQVQLRIASVQDKYVTRHIEVAVAQWNKWLGWEMFVLSEYDFDVFVVHGGPSLFAVGRVEIMKFWDNPDIEDGGIMGMIVLYDMPHSYRYEVILHEMGHILGLAHDVDERGFLMTQGVAKHGTQVAPEDVRALRKLYQ